MVCLCVLGRALERREAIAINGADDPKHVKIRVDEQSASGYNSNFPATTISFNANSAVRYGDGTPGR
jgi:hypothetical protein